MIKFTPKLFNTGKIYKINEILNILNRNIPDIQIFTLGINTSHKMYGIEYINQINNLIDKYISNYDIVFIFDEFKFKRLNSNQFICQGELEDGYDFYLSDSIDNPILSNDISLSNFIRNTHKYTYEATIE